MKRHLPIFVTAVATILQANPALAKSWKATTWGANTGALSYTFFNLSGDGCTIAYPTTSSSSTVANPGVNWNGYAGQSCSYNNQDVPTNCTWSVSSGDANIFMVFVANVPYTGAANLKPSGSTAVFFQQADPVQTPVTIASGNPTNGIAAGTSGSAWSAGWTLGASGSFPMNKSNNPGSGTLPGNSISSGASSSWYEGTAQMAGNNSSAAVADSFTVQCSGGGASNILMANIANAGTSFNSGETNDGMIFNAYNADINPPGPGSSTNQNGAGIVSNLNQVANFNQPTTAANYQGTGGLWSAVDNPNTQAAYSLVPAMLPINLSNWVNLDGYSQTAIYGGHFTVAIGDPFIVSSFNAKILWYLATNPKLALKDATFSSPGADGYTTMLSALTANSGGVFDSSSNANSYVKWLFNAASQAAAVTYAAYQYAGNPKTYESLWGKLFTAAANQVIEKLDAAIFAESGIPAPAANGILKNNADRAITNAFTSTHNAPAAPTLQTAPVNLNATFSAGNLLGLLMANVMVQTQLNIATDTQTGYANPVWANYTMYNQNQCVQATMQISGNEFPAGTASSGVVQCYDTQNKNAATNLVSKAGTYTNICSGSSTGSAGCASDAGAQLNIWDAVLLGSDITASANGQTLLTSSPSTAAFSPPTLIADASIGSINTTFNASTGVVTLANYIPVESVPATQPTVNPGSGGFSANGCDSYQYQAQGLSYDASTGVLTATQYQGGCPGAWTGAVVALPGGPISLNMNTCVTGSAVNFNPVATVSKGLSSASLSCVTPATVTPPNTVALDYNLCVTDPNATGGVLAVNLGTASSPKPALACACIPSYIGGATASSGTAGYYATSGGQGILLGATSASATTTVANNSSGGTTITSSTTQQCAVPGSGS